MAFPQSEMLHTAADTVISSYAEQLDEVLVTVQRSVYVPATVGVKVAVAEEVLLN